MFLIWNKGRKKISRPSPRPTLRRLIFIIHDFVPYNCFLRLYFDFFFMRITR